LPNQSKGSELTERGSLAPLGIGLAMLSLMSVLAILAAGSVYLTERRLTTLAESSALAVLVEASGNLTQPLGPIANQHLNQEATRGLHQVEIVSVSATDQRTVRVRLCATWQPIFPSYMFSEIGKVCSEGLARRGR
jgi:hypothetical protein